MNGFLFLQLIILPSGESFGFWYAPNTYTITYNTNGGYWTNGTGPTENPQTKYYGVTVNLTSYAPKKDGGYVFVGWSTSSSATSATYSPGGSFTTNANTTLYAVYQKATVSSVTLSVSGTIWRGKGEYFDVTAYVDYSPKDATIPTIYWYASNGNVSFSTTSGSTTRVTGAYAGTAYVSASAGGVPSSSIYVCVANLRANSSTPAHYANDDPPTVRKVV